MFYSDQGNHGVMYMFDDFERAWRFLKCVIRPAKECISSCYNKQRLLTKHAKIYNISVLLTESSSSFGPAQCDPVNRVRWGTKQH